MQKLFLKFTGKQSGFTLIEIMIAMLVLFVGLVAVAQLVPLAVTLNAANRQDSTALVIAQRELNEMAQPRNLNLPSFTDDLNNLCSLGDPANPGQLVGSAVVVADNRPLIDFGATQQAGYSFNYVDPNDPFHLTYDVRWAVVTLENSGAVTGKRFILGVRRLGGNQPLLPITLDTLVEK